MNETPKSDDELLARAFPASAKRIGSLRVLDSSLNELCDDFLVVLRSYTCAAQDHETNDASYLADLSESLEDLRQEIEIHLNLTNHERSGGTYYEKDTE